MDCLDCLDWLPTFYVMCNPEYEPIRYQLLLKHLPARGIPLEKVKFVHGPWGSEITSETYFSVYDPYNHRFGSDTALCFKAARLLKAEVSLILSFHKALHMALEDGVETAIFFESDVILRDDFLPRLKIVLEECASKEWDYISLSEGVGTRPPGHDASYFGPTKVYEAPHRFVFRCCDSMLLRRSFLEKLSQTLLPVRECLDWEMNIQMMIHGGKSLWVDPPLVEPGSGRWRTLSLLPS
jgi:hypothetical protein